MDNILQDVCNDFFNDDINMKSQVIMSFHSMAKNSKQPIGKNVIYNFVVNSKEFNRHFEKLYNVVINKIFIPNSDEEVIHNDLEVLKKDCMNYLIRTKKACNLTAIEDYVKNSMVFNKKYGMLILSSYEHFFNHTLSDRTQQKILAKLREQCFMSSTVSIDKMLKEEIMSVGMSETGAGTTYRDEDSSQRRNSVFTEVYLDVMKVAPTLDDVTRYQMFLQHEDTLVRTYLHSRYKSYSFYFENITNSFYEVFGRDITVFEYIRYYDRFIDDGNTVELLAYKTDFDRKFDLAYQTYNDYIDAKIDYGYFVKNYIKLFDVSDEEFLTEVIAVVTTNKKYTNVMRDKITKIYKTSYTVDISALDLSYFYLEVHALRLSLVDDKLVEKITTLKQETDTYMDNIQNLFKRVLLREADSTELDTYVTYFRDKRPTLRPEIRLESELYASLEYNDILKEMIRSHLQTRQKGVQKGQLYKCLEYILSLDDIEVKRSEASVCKAIDALITIPD